LLLAGVFAAAIAVYLSSLGGGFVWDDRQLILDDRAIKSWEHLGEIFTQDFFERREDDLPYGYYRPVTTLSYVLDFSLWSLYSPGYHATNLLLHALCSVLVAWLLLELGWGGVATVVAALLFAVHPIHAENVAWIAGRTDPLAFFFCAIAFLCHLRSLGDRLSARRRRLLTIISVASFAIAMLAKEMSVVLIGWLAAFHFLPARSYGVSFRRAVLPYAVVTLAYVVWRFVVIEVGVPGVSREHGIFAALLSAPPTIARYLSWLVIPVGPSAYVQNPYVTFIFDERLIFSIIFFAVAFLIGTRLIRPRSRTELAIAMLLVSFAPILNFVRVAAPPDMGNVMAERFLYFPSFPFVALVGLGVQSIWRRAAGSTRTQTVIIGAVALVVFALAGATVARNRVWRDEATFLQATLEQAPGAVLLWGNLAQHHLRAGNLEDASDAIDRAATLAPDSYWVRSARALLYVMNGRVAEAIPLQKSIAIEARYGRIPALNNLAYLYRVTNQEDEAVEILEEIVERDQGYVDVYFNLAEIYAARGEIDAARRQYHKALDDRPNQLRVAEALASLELAGGRIEEAERIYHRMLESYPDDPRLLNNIALMRYRGGDIGGALRILEALVEDHPQHARARINYAQLLYGAGRAEEAVGHLEANRELTMSAELRETNDRLLETMRAGRALDDDGGADVTP
jgi:tetratricopeptide (TPR) repeat protein